MARLFGVLFLSLFLVYLLECAPVIRKDFAMVGITSLFYNMLLEFTCSLYGFLIMAAIYD